MKKIFFIILTLLSIAAYSQSPTKGALNTIDTTYKPNIKMLAVNKLDNTVVFWDLVSWSQVATGGTIIPGWKLTGNTSVNPSTTFLGTTDSSDFTIRTNNDRRVLVEGGVSMNIAMGRLAMPIDQKGLLGYLGTRGNNVVIGNNALQANIGGSSNTALGTYSMVNNTTGSYNQAIGQEAMVGNTTGIRNIAIGNASLSSLSNGFSNIAVGAHSMQNAWGNENALVGHYSNQGGGSLFPIGQNAMVGHRAGTWGATGGTFMGYYAHAGVSILSSASFHSTAIGYNSMLNVRGDTSCYALGDSSFVSDSLKNAGAIGSHALVSSSNSMVLGSISGINGSTADTKVGIGTSAPNSILHVNGSFATAYTEKTATYPITVKDQTINCTSGTFTVTLPTAVGCAGREYFITNSGAGTITLATTSSQVFQNITATPTSVTLLTLTGILVKSTGAAWIKVSSF